MSETETLSLEAARELLTTALAASGLRLGAARSVALALAAAEAEGQMGHGFSRLAEYAAQVRTGKVDRAAVPNLEVTGQSAALVDARHGFAYPAIDVAIDWATSTAGETGVASVGIFRSHHSGALSVHVDKIARAGFIGLMVTNAPAAIAPWGSNTPLFGTNPIAFAAPRASGAPLVIDLSLSRVARGKVMHAKKTGRPIPEGWALDADGNPTTDAEAALGGSMVAIGEAKGTALAMMVEVLAATLTGAVPSADMSSFFDAEGPPPGTGQYLLVIRPPDSAGFAERLETLLRRIEAMEGARLPGSRRIAALRKAETQGIIVPRQYVETARALAAGA